MHSNNPFFLRLKAGAGGYGSIGGVSTGRVISDLCGLQGRTYGDTVHVIDVDAIAYLVVPVGASE